MLYARPSDLIGAAEALSSSGAAVDDGYPLGNLHDGDPINPCRFTGTAATRIVWDHGSAISIDALMIVLYTFAAGTVLKVEANTADSWVAPAYSKNVTVPAWPDLLPQNITVDLRGTLMDTTGCRYRSLYIPAQSANHGIGEILWIPALRATGRRCQYPVKRGDVRRAQVNSTSYGVDHVNEKLVRQRRLLPNFPQATDSDRDAFLALHRDAQGSKKGWPLILDPDEISTKEHFFVRFHPETSKDWAEQLDFINLNELSLDVLELQRGLPL